MPPNQMSNLFLIWTTIWMIVIASILFGIAVVNFTFIYYALAPMILGLGCGTTFVVRKCREKNSSFCLCSCMCSCTCCPEPQSDSEGNNKCLRCLEDALCLHPHRPSESQLRRLEAIQIRQAQLQSSEVSRSSAANPLDATHSSFGMSPSSMRCQLRRLEEEINRLFQELSQLENEAVSSENISVGRLSADARHLRSVFNKVGGWIEGSSVPRTEDIATVRSRLGKISRHFTNYKNGNGETNATNFGSFGEPPQTARSERRTHGHSRHPARTPRDSSIDTECTNEHLFSVGLVEPPAYQEIDPLRCTSPVSSVDLASERFSIDLPQTQAGSTFTLAPPPVDFNAPPSYEEATTTQV